MIIELRSCLTSPSTLELASDHQLSKDGTIGCGERLYNLTLWSNKNQNYWANTQPTSKWLIVSGSWSQRGQRVGQLGVANLSFQVYQLPNICCEPPPTRHIKKWHLPGAHDLQILSQGPKRTAPWNNSIYADSWKTPRMQVLHSGTKNYFWYNSPKLQEFSNEIHRKPTKWDCFLQYSWMLQKVHTSLNYLLVAAVDDI